MKPLAVTVSHRTVHGAIASPRIRARSLIAAADALQRIG
jgi:hypothetical protein